MKGKKKLRIFFVIILVILAVFIAGAVILLTHTQIIVGAIHFRHNHSVNYRYEGKIL